MPFYEYECSNCGFRDEVLQQISDKPLKKCPSCGKSTLKKLVSAPVFRLKGSGWYETDFKSDKENKRNLAGSDKDEPKADAKSEPAKSEGTKSDSTKAESKPAAKAAPVKTRARPKSSPKAKARKSRR